MQKQGDTRQERFLQAVKSLQLRFPVAEIVAATSYSKSTVSAYVNGTREPSGDFVRTFCKHYNIDFASVWETKRKEEPLLDNGNQPADKDRLVTILEKQVSLLEAEIKRLEGELQRSSIDLGEYALANNALLKTILHCVGRVRAKAEKVDLDKILVEHNKVLHEETEKLLREGK